MKLFTSQSVLATSLNDAIPKGSYKSIIFDFSGTNIAALAVAVADLGRLRIIRGGVDIVNAEFQDLANFNNAEAGTVVGTSVVGGAFHFQIRYNFGFIEDLENIFRVDRGDNASVQVMFGATVPGLVASGTLNCYLVSAKGIEKYHIRTYDFSQNMPIAGGVISPKLEQVNVQSIYCRTGADFGNFQIQKDNYALVNATGPVLVADTAYSYRLETAPTFIYLELNKTRQTAEMISDNLQFYLTSAMVAPGNTTILYRQIVFDAKKTATSLESMRDFHSQKIVKAPSVQAVQNVLGIAPPRPVGTVQVATKPRVQTLD